jgi:hypothetical protein
MAAHRLRSSVAAVLVLLSLAVGAAPAEAQTTTFTSRAAWDAAVGPHVTINFEGIAPANGVQDFPAGLSVSGVTFLGAVTPFNDSNVRFLEVQDGSLFGVSVWSSGQISRP